MPADLKNGRVINIVPVMFNVGINDEETLAKNFGDISLESDINLSSLNTFKNYTELACDEFTKTGCMAPRNCQLVRQLLSELEKECNPRQKQYKNVAILHLVSQICRMLRGLLFISCKSGKDRTSMAVTLEEAFILMRHFHLPEAELQKTLDALRTGGTRRDNVKKNTDGEYYAFSSIRMKFLPDFYKPPAGTYSGGAQT